MNGPRVALRLLAPEEAGANRLLSRLAVTHPGVRIVRPHYANEPWRVAIDQDAIPGDSREMILTSYQPSELLAKVEKLLSGPEGDPG